MARAEDMSGATVRRSFIAPRARGIVYLTQLAAIATSATDLASRPAWAQSSQQAQEAAQGAIRRLDLQTEFPREPEPLSWHFNLPQEALWVVIAIAVAILLYALRDVFMAWRAGAGGAWTQQDDALAAAARGPQAMMLGAADELAAEGRFAEAMHMLLLQGLAHVRQWLDQPLSDSLTSREILRGTDLPVEARTALRDVVSRVELTYFGKYPAAAADYSACRASFNALAQSLYGAMA
jgi:hypothetical protein